MATKKPVIEEIEELEDMNETSGRFTLGDMTVAVKPEEKPEEGPRVRIYLPKLEDSGSEGLAVDQVEHVTIANELGEINYRIQRGVWVDVPVQVFIVLKEKYPDI